MERYESYKDSGIEWIGKIPSHWGIIPLKRIMQIRNGQDYKLYTDNDRYPVIGSGGCFAYCSKFLYDGEALLLGRKGTIDKPLYIKGRFWAVDTMFYAVPKISLSVRYCYYQALTIPFDKYSTSTALPSMTQTDLGYHIFCLPPFVEQQAIVAYLDRRCSEIDKAIATQQKRIALLQELKQSIITHAVTRGIHPDVPLKDSGVEWIGKVPEHWALVRIKDICRIYGRIGYRGYTEKDLVSEGEGAITLSPSNLQGGKMNYSKCSYLSWQKYYESPEIMIFNNDIIFVKTGSTYGKCAIVENLPMEATINPQSIVFKNIKCNAAFLNYMLLSDVIQIQVKNSVVGGTIPTIAQDKINNYKFVLPLLPEQQEIVAYIDDQLLNVDMQITKAERQIELLQELRQSMIIEAITGKVKV